MKKRLLSIVASLPIFIFAIILSSCSNSTKDYSNYASVIYHLEGGKYAGSDEDVTVYYNIAEGETKSLGNTLDKLDSREIEANGEGKTLAGWYLDENYTTEVTNDYKICYKQEINLYAKWKNATNYSWAIKAKINDEDVTLATYKNADEGEALVIDSQRKATIKEALLAKNLTYAEEFTYDGKTYTESNVGDIVMPEKESDYECVVYVNYIEGKYQLIHNESDLTKALKDMSDYDGLYLMSDITSTSDLELYKINGSNDKQIEIVGNNHTLTYSFKTFDATTIIYNNQTYSLGSVFGNMNNLYIHDLNIVITDLKVNNTNTLLAGFAVSMNNSKISNVDVNITYSAIKKYDVGGDNAWTGPSDLTTYKGVYDTEDSSGNTIENFTFKIEKKK